MKSRKTLLPLCLALALLTVLAPVSGSAEFLEVTNRFAFLNNDQVDWVVAEDQAFFGSFNFPSTNFGLNVTVSNNSLFLLLEPFGVNGFGPTDYLLFSLDNFFSIDFPVNIFGAGAQIRSNANDLEFRATISAYDAAQSLLYSFSVDTSAPQGPYVADFLGILDSNAQIRRITFETDAQIGGQDAGTFINQLDFLVCTTCPPPVPIPGALWLLGSGLIGLIACRRHFNKEGRRTLKV